MTYAPLLSLTANYSCPEKVSLSLPVYSHFVAESAMDTYRKLYFPGRIKIRILNRESLPAQPHFLHKHPFAYHERVHLKELFWSSDGNQCSLINVLSTWRLKILSVTGVKIHLKTSQIGWPCTCKAWIPHSLVEDMRAEYVNQFRKNCKGIQRRTDTGHSQRERIRLCFHKYRL